MASLFASAIPGLEFLWASSNNDVCEVKSVYDKVAVRISYV